MKALKHFFDKNLEWANRIKKSDPDFFKKLSQQQEPDYLWIGCSDSRVPATEIVDMLPGEIFVHRNIANLVNHSDENCLSVVQYAVEILEIEHIIICGHYGCGGINAVMSDHASGLIDDWLSNVKEVYRCNQQKIDALATQKEKSDLLCELNVIAQVKSLCGTAIVKNAWKASKKLCVHGWIYNIEDGILKDLDVCINSSALAQEIPGR